MKRGCTLNSSYMNPGVFRELLITAPTSQQYKLTNELGQLALIGQGDDQVTILRIRPKKSDGGDIAGFLIIGKDPLRTMANSEYLAMLYLNAPSEYRIYTDKSGTGALRKLRFFVGAANLGQLDLETNGNVTVNKSLNVTNTVVAGTVNAGTMYADTGVFEYLTYSYSDPEIEGWQPTTRDKVKLFAEKAFAYQGGVIRFFNQDTRSFEIFEPATGKFYCEKALIDLPVVEQCEPVVNKNIEKVSQLDKLTGQMRDVYKVKQVKE